MTIALGHDREEFSLDQFTADGGRGHKRIMPANGTRPAEPLFPDRIYARVLEDLEVIRAPGAISLTAMTPATGSRTFTLTTAVALRAGVYRAASFGDPTCVMVGTLLADQAAGTSLTLDVSLATGAEERSDWVISSLVSATSPRVRQTISADRTLVATDTGTLLEVTAAATITLPLLAGLPASFAVDLVNAAPGTVYLQPSGGELIGGLDRRIMVPGSGVSLQVSSAAWLITAAHTPQALIETLLD